MILPVKEVLVEAKKYIGKTIGEWTCTDVEKKDGNIYMKVRCTCGTESMIRKDSFLATDRAMSCHPCSAKKNKNGEEIPCSNCGSIVYRTRSRIGNSKTKRFFCSKSCAGEYSSGLNKDNTVCENCNESFYSSPSMTRRFCSRACWKEFNRSEGPSYYRKFKELKCSKCGFVPEDQCQLDIHHSDSNKTNNDINNLITLCANCHRLAHSIERKLTKETE